MWHCVTSFTVFKKQIFSLVVGCFIWMGNKNTLDSKKMFDYDIYIIMNKTLPDLNELNTLKGKIIDNTSTNLSIEYKSVPKDKYYKYMISDIHTARNFLAKMK